MCDASKLLSMHCMNSLNGRLQNMRRRVADHQLKLSGNTGLQRGTGAKDDVGLLEAAYVPGER